MSVSRKIGWLMLGGAAYVGLAMLCMFGVVLPVRSILVAALLGPPLWLADQSELSSFLWITGWFGILAVGTVFCEPIREVLAFLAFAVWISSGLWLYIMSI
jgi:hypothetical protein